MKNYCPNPISCKPSLFKSSIIALSSIHVRLNGLSVFSMKITLDFCLLVVFHTQNLMKYTHPYYKLGNKIYTTIRKSKKKEQVIGFVEKEISGNSFHRAVILHIGKIHLKQVQIGFLLVDCLYPNSNIKSRKDCYDLFQSFYKNPIDFKTQVWFLFIMKRLDKSLGSWI